MAKAGLGPEAARRLAEGLRQRYEQGDRVVRGQVLDTFCGATGYHRKAAIRLLKAVGAGRPATRGRGRGRRATYDAADKALLRQVWAASNQSCGKRLAPMLGTLVEALERHGELVVPEERRERLVQMSAATIDRLLVGARGPTVGRRPSDPTGSATLRMQVPVRTFGDWGEAPPGACQGDLVLHCGATSADFFLTSLVLVDVVLGWSECEAVWGKGQTRVCSAVHAIRERLPVPLRELHTDNGSEFLNQTLVPYCRREGIRLTRGRPYRKNDQAYVEQRNWFMVRRMVGYDRYATRAAHAQLQAIYQPLCWYMNYFQPIRKLIGKERVGSQVRKRFDQAQTPYQRLLALEVLTAKERAHYAAFYQTLNPAQLLRDIDTALARLWALAGAPGAAGAAAPGAHPRRAE